MASKRVIDQIREKYGFKVTWAIPGAMRTNSAVDHSWHRPPKRHSIFYNPKIATDEQLLEKAEWMSDKIADGTAQKELDDRAKKSREFEMRFHLTEVLKNLGQR